jgi:hypothetical protein
MGGFGGAIVLAIAGFTGAGGRQELDAGTGDAARRDAGAEDAEADAADSGDSGPTIIVLAINGFAGPPRRDGSI